jgi:hypothetical protein
VARRKPRCDMDTVSAFRVAARYLTALALSVEMPYDLALTHMTDEQLICCVATDAADARLAHERNWTGSTLSEYSDLLANLEKELPKDNKEAMQQMITQVLRIEIAHYRAVALIADETHWQAISEEAASMLASKTENGL